MEGYAVLKRGTGFMECELNNRPEELCVCYLDLLKKALTHTLWKEQTRLLDASTMPPSFKRFMVAGLSGLLKSFGVGLVRYVPSDADLRVGGEDWPEYAHTMIGMKRLDNVQQCIESIIRDNVPGDLIETGIWRGGAVIFMRGVLKAYNIKDRVVWAADSFEGIPVADEEKYPADSGNLSHVRNITAVSQEEVSENFKKYGLLDDQVRFIPGWFKDTLPDAPIEKLALMRLDGDLYQSTIEALENLYPKLSKGGYVIIDDYAWPACQQAVHDYRSRNNINDAINQIDKWGVYWRRS